MTITGVEAAKGVLGLGGAALVYGFTREMIDVSREFTQLVADPVFFGWDVARGDNHPIVVIPGFLAGDGYLGTMRNWLSRMGYVPVASGLKRNTGHLSVLIEEVKQRVAAAVGQYGQPATLIGHSLGGVIACGIANSEPKLVRDIITMGSPLGMRTAHLHEAIPLTAFFSRKDRIVRYPRALAPADKRNIEITGSHCGMAFNSQVYRHLSHLLTAPN